MERNLTNRKPAPRPTINTWMTQELQRVHGCEQCQLSLSYRLRIPDADGCNWTDAILRTGPDGDLRDVIPIARGIVERARQMFNLSDDAEDHGTPFMRRALCIPPFHIDTNAINGKQQQEDINRLERWAEDEVIIINMSWAAHAEAQAVGDPRRIKKAARQIYTIDTGDADHALAEAVGAALFPTGPLNENQRNDVRVVCEAIKYQATLVTNDGASRSQPGGILGNQHKLRALTDIEILSPSKAVDFVVEKIRERDEFNRLVAQKTGNPLPDWTGED